MAATAWKRLLAGAPWFRQPGQFPIAAYSEFLPPPRCQQKPFGSEEPGPYDPRDPHGWQVSEYEEAWQLQPGLRHLAAELLHALEHLGQGRPTHGIAQAKLENNPFWPEILAQRAGTLEHERYVVLAPLALSKTQDDKGRIRWTLFGGSEQGPAHALWQSFWTAPGRELPHDTALSFLVTLLRDAYGVALDTAAGLYAAGLRFLPGLGSSTLPYPGDPPLPSWASRYCLSEESPLGKTKYLLSFRPFGSLPRSIQRAYLAGKLHLLPCPQSLVFWGAPPFLRLHQELPLALQIPLLHLFERSENPWGLRVPQAGWMHEPHPEHPTHDPRRGPLRNTFRRTHRWERIHRHEDALAVADGEDHVAHVLFSNRAEDMGLYDKPMARNAQIWTHDFQLLLDGPQADPAALEHATQVLREGGSFGYRFQYPAMRVGRHELYWHRPLVAYRSARTAQPELLADAPLGYLTAYRAERPEPARAIVLWPRLQKRAAQMAAIRVLDGRPEHSAHRLALQNVRNLLTAWTLQGEQPLARSFARALLKLPPEQTLDDWLTQLESTAEDRASAQELVAELRRRLQPESDEPHATRRRPPESLTYRHTARRSFETAYWRTIARLAHGRFRNKDNADCIHDAATQARLRHHHSDLAALGDYLLNYYEQLLRQTGMDRRASVGEFPFHWQTDFAFPWSGGWLDNQRGTREERDLVVVIPGRDRRRAIIMADHYDTAYMEDCFDKSRGGSGARLAAAGADDNHSATAALMLGARVFLELSRQGQLACDVWLVHLTGEEFPSDCLGARHLAQAIVEGTLVLRRRKRRPLDLSRVQIDGVYVLDMIAHNNDHERDVFQISPGTCPQSLRLAREAHAANQLWNQSVPAWNQRGARRTAGRGERLPDPRGRTIPATARHLELQGEVRLAQDSRSSLYNTDGQIFSDAGIPVVLFMENYDINRQGYHDTHDTMANLDLDFGAALAAITIETVARAATNR